MGKTCHMPGGRAESGGMMENATKMTMARTLLELLEEKQLDEITVTQLVERCGVSRQTFYYHFSDLYAVVEWVLQRELEAVKRAPAGQWRQVLGDMLAKFRQHRVPLLNAYRAYERSYVEHYFSQWLRPLIDRTVEAAAARHPVTPQQVEFVEKLYTMGLVSIVLGWVDRGMPSSMVDRLDDFYAILDGSLDSIMERLGQRARGRGDV